MDLTTLCFALVISFSWTFWGIVGKYAGITGPWYVALVTGGDFALAAALASLSIRHQTIPADGAITLILLAGAINGFGTYLYTWRSGVIPAAAPFLTTISVMAILWAFVLDLLLNGRIPSAMNIAGVGCAILAVILLRL